MLERPRRSVPAPPSELFGPDPETGEPLEGYTLPEPLICEAWYRFFLAVRTMVGRKYPRLVPVWDDASYILSDQQIHHEDPQSVAKALETLCTILERPGAAKLRKFYPHLKTMYEHTKAILSHCMKLRNRPGRRMQYEPLKGPWYVEPELLSGDPPWPGPPVPKDSPEFYRVALRELYGDWKVPDDILQQCVTANPAEAAKSVVGEWARLKPDYLAKKIYSQSRRPSRKS